MTETTFGKCLFLDEKKKELMFVTLMNKLNVSDRACFIADIEKNMDIVFQKITQATATISEENLNFLCDMFFILDATLYQISGKYKLTRLCLQYLTELEFGAEKYLVDIIILPLNLCRIAIESIQDFGKKIEKASVNKDSEKLFLGLEFFLLGKCIADVPKDIWRYVHQLNTIDVENHSVRDLKMWKKWSNELAFPEYFYIQGLVNFQQKYAAKIC